MCGRNFEELLLINRYYYRYRDFKDACLKKNNFSILKLLQCQEMILIGLIVIQSLRSEKGNGI